jgi:hypothetical protein
VNLWDFSTPELAYELVSRPDGLAAIPDAAIRSEAGRRIPSGHGGRPVVLKACKYCRHRFSAADMRKHIPRCERNPNRRSARTDPLAPVSP